MKLKDTYYLASEETKYRVFDTRIKDITERRLAAKIFDSSIEVANFLKVPHKKIMTSRKMGTRIGHYAVRPFDEETFKNDLYERLF